jgi:hypothetical protein
MKDRAKSFYQFNGCWFDVLDMLVGIIKPTNAQRFSIWEGPKKNDGHLLIVYELRLAEDWQQKHKVKKISEPEFQTTYKARIKEHVIHGYNEFDKNGKSSL